MFRLDLINAFLNSRLPYLEKKQKRRSFFKQFEFIRLRKRIVDQIKKNLFEIGEDVRLCVREPINKFQVQEFINAVHVHSLQCISLKKKKIILI